MKFKLFLIPFLIILLFFACDEKNSVDVSSPASSSLKLLFQDGYNQLQGWVILYESDAQTIKEFKSFTGDAVVEFEDIQEETVNFTFITSRFDDEMNYRLTTNIGVPGGEWTFHGNNYSDKGKVTVAMTYPENEYQHCFLGTSSPSRRAWIYGSSSAFEFENLDVNYLNTDGTFSLYGTIYNSENNTGYCGWLLNQPFELGVTNNYSLNMTSPLNFQTMNLNELVSYIDVVAYTDNDYEDDIDIFYNSFPPTNEPIVLAPHNFPAKVFETEVLYFGDQYIKIFTTISESIPNSMSIPNFSLTASYDDVNARYYNISYTGEADEISASWEYDDDEQNTDFYWRVYASGNANSISLPSLPSDIANQIPGFDQNKFEEDGISMIDFDSCEDIADVIQMIYKNETGYRKNHTERYDYVYYPDSFGNLSKNARIEKYVNRYNEF